jgi:hypothetical protein
MDAQRLLPDLQSYVERHGVRVITAGLPPDTPAEFDGLTITLNPDRDPAASAFILAHSFASIVAWAVDRTGVQRLFDELRDAKCDRDGNPDRFERALSRFRAFEIAASEYAVSVLDETHHPDAIDPYTVYFRADVEAITMFHRYDRAPVWDAFYPQWLSDTASGARHTEPFQPRPVPPFTPVRIERQQVKQQLRTAAHPRG